MPGFLSDKIPDAFENILTGFQQFCSQCQEKYLQVLLEDFGSAEAPFGTSSQVLYFLKSIPGLQACLDTGNFEFFGEDLKSAYARLRGRIALVHCKDHTRSFRPGSECEFHTLDGQPLYSAAAGDGFLPLESVVKQLIADGYQGDFSLEHFGTPDMLGDILRSAENISRWIQEVKVGSSRSFL